METPVVGHCVEGAGLEAEELRKLASRARQSVEGGRLVEVAKAHVERLKLLRLDAEGSGAQGQVAEGTSRLLAKLQAALLAETEQMLKARDMLELIEAALGDVSDALDELDAQQAAKHLRYLETIASRCNVAAEEQKKAARELAGEIGQALHEYEQQHITHNNRTKCISRVSSSISGALGGVTLTLAGTAAATFASCGQASLLVSEAALASVACPLASFGVFIACGLTFGLAALSMWSHAENDQAAGCERAAAECKTMRENAIRLALEAAKQDRFWVEVSDHALSMAESLEQVQHSLDAGASMRGLKKTLELAGKELASFRGHLEQGLVYSVSMLEDRALHRRARTMIGDEDFDAIHRGLGTTVQLTGTRGAMTRQLVDDGAQPSGGSGPTLPTHASFLGDHHVP